MGVSRGHGQDHRGRPRGQSKRAESRRSAGTSSRGGPGLGNSDPCSRSGRVLSSPPPNHLLVHLIHIFLLLLLKTKGVQSLK